MKKIKIVSVTAAIILPLLIFAGSAVDVVTPFEIPVAPRALGMGGAFIAVPGDINGFLYNPAGLGYVKYYAISAIHNTWIWDTYKSYLAFGIPRKYGTFVLSGIYFNEGEAIKMEGGTPTGEEVRAFMSGLAAGYGVEVKDGLLVGVTGKFIYSYLAGYLGNSIAIDMGLIWCKRMDDRRLSLGLVLQNAGTPIRYRETYSPQPMNIGVGGAFTIWNPNVCLNVAVDMNYPYWGGVVRYNLGAELWLKDVFALRAGYRGGYDLSNYTFGVGLKVNKFILDYAYAPNYATGEYAEYVNPSHKLGITYLFIKEPVKIVPEQMEEIKKAIEESEARLREDITSVKLSVDEVEKKLDTILETMVTPDEILHMLTIHFPFGSAVIPDEEYPKLYEALRVINKYYKGKTITIEGHCDELGSAEYNLELSRRRAEAVKAFFVENGIPEELLVVVAKGEEELLSHRTGPGTPGIENRRVVFIVK